MSVDSTTIKVVAAQLFRLTSNLEISVEDATKAWADAILLMTPAERFDLICWVQYWLRSQPSVVQLRAVEINGKLVQNKVTEDVLKSVGSYRNRTILLSTYHLRPETIKLLKKWSSEEKDDHEDIIHPNFLSQVDFLVKASAPGMLDGRGYPEDLVAIANWLHEKGIPHGRVCTKGDRVEGLRIF